jgi:hypothetical protein
MPWLDEVGYYLYGIRLLLEGRLDGLKWLDFSDRGFWRSWWALVFCLPPMLLNWAAFRISYLATMPDGASAGPTLVVGLGVVDISSWILCYLALAVVMTIVGYAAFIRPMIIALNWLSIPLQWLGVVVSLIQIFVPLETEIYVPISLGLLLISAVAYFLVIRQIAERKMAPALAFLLTLVVSSIWLTNVLGEMLDLPS